LAHPELFDSWFPLSVVAAVALAAVAVASRILLKIGKRLLHAGTAARTVMDCTADAGRLVASLIALQALWQAAPDALHLISAVRHLTAVLLVASFTWLLTRVIAAAGRVVVLRYPVNMADNRHARGIQTQARVLVRTLTLFVIVFGLAFALMTFPGVRQIGAGLLASAGLAGLVVGFAAKPLLGNVLAGLQIAMTQPIRLDDVVIVEGEFGRIEEITGSYVVIAVWDERRMIVPLQWFIEHPFQNWTRTSAQILGSVFLWVDFGFPVEPLRKELARLCEGNADWDRRVCNIQVTDSSDRAMQLRILVSSASASQNGDLRCFLRERLLDYISRENPDYFPKLRIDDPRPAPQPDSASPA
jgi:small-conductance mechanosensitive channel